MIRKFTLKLQLLSKHKLLITFIAEILYNCECFIFQRKALRDTPKWFMVDVKLKKIHMVSSYVLP